MPRIPYVLPEPGQLPEAEELRKKRQLHVLDGMFLNAPALAMGYDNLFGAILKKTIISPALRELLILRVAALNYAALEWIAHEPMGRTAGLTDDQIAAIRNVSYVRNPSSNPVSCPPTSPALTPMMIAALEYADAMTVDVKVPQKVFNALKVHLSDQEMVEATVTVAGYNLTSRVILATNVGDAADKEVPQVKVKSKL